MGNYPTRPGSQAAITPSLATRRVNSDSKLSSLGNEFIEGEKEGKGSGQSESEFLSRVTQGWLVASSNKMEKAIGRVLPTLPS